MSRLALLSAIAMTLLVPAAATTAPLHADISGSYRMPGGAIITISACDDGVVCGRLVRLGDLAPTDKNNPVAEMQNRALCGVTVLDRLSAEQDYWRAVLYDAHNGTEYNIAVTLGKNGAIDISGHTTRPFLSRTYARPLEVWARVPAPASPCVPALTS
jgi:uncharacterized protein (DUF2147 family)